MGQGVAYAEMPLHPELAKLSPFLYELGDSWYVAGALGSCKTLFVAV
jgi:hypothetical protein